MSRTSPPAQRSADSEVPEVAPNSVLTRAGVNDIPTDDGKTVALYNGPAFDEDALREIASFDDALSLLAQSDTPVVDASQVMGNGFAILNDKGILSGVKLLLLSWRFNRGDKGVFCSAYVIAQMPGMNVPAKFVLNDGSTGICKQLMDYTAKTGKYAGLLVKNGLRRSDYQYTAPDGSTSDATTFYLDLSA